MISVVLPTRNEPTVQDLIAQLRETMKSVTTDYEILAVDKSDDDTPSRLRRAGVDVLAQKSRGLGGAIIEGLRAARGDPILVMDADLSHNPRFIPAFIKKSLEGFDIVVGSRRVGGGGIVGWGIYRRLVSWIGNVLGRVVAGVDASDLTSGYRLYSRKAVGTLDFDRLRSSGYAFQLEVLAEASERGLRIGSVPIVFTDRSAGVSKLSRKDIFEFLLTALRLGLRRLRHRLPKTPSLLNQDNDREE
ncbi:glycosyltransferase [Candidatus Bathyarchaeota archaeon]|nr:glycosyltransferase [Candidatus Bathyarchaeota archaeon]